MSVAITSRSITDGLQFYIDTNNVKSYVGQPTTNLNNQISNYTGSDYAYGGEWSSDPTRFTKTYNSTISTPIGTGATLCVESGTAGYYHLSRMGGDGENGLNSISCYVYPLSSISNFTIGMLNDSGNQVSFNLDTKAITYGSGIENRSAFCVDVPGYPGWLRVGANIEGRVGGWVGCVGINTGGSYTPSAPYKSFYITGLQYEAKQSPTAYVFGTRSVTQGLVDVTGNFSVDLTNASYDSGSVPLFINNGTTVNTITATPYNLITNTQTQYTRVAWFYLTSYSSAWSPIIQNSIGNNSDMGLTVLSDGKLHFRQYTKTYTSGTTDGDYGVSGTLTVAINRWNMGAIAVNRTANTVSLYLNGVLDSTSAINVIGNSNSNTIIIGGASTDSYSGGRMFKGYISSAFHYNRILSSDEILKLYNRTKSRYRL